MIGASAISVGRISFLIIEMIDATMQPLALLGGTFYSMGMSSLILTMVARSPAQSST
jgi:hypothetical protein